MAIRSGVFRLPGSRPPFRSVLRETCATTATTRDVFSKRQARLKTHDYYTLQNAAVCSTPRLRRVRCDGRHGFGGLSTVVPPLHPCEHQQVGPGRPEPDQTSNQCFGSTCRRSGGDGDHPKPLVHTHRSGLQQFTIVNRHVQPNQSRGRLCGSLFQIR